MKATPKYFVCCWLGLTGAGLALVMALNVLVDATGAFPSLHLKTFEPLRYLENGRVTKAEMARRGDWNVIILGTSRARAGFPADHPFLATNRCCNLALDGAPLPEISTVFDYALQRNPDLKHVILGLDWFIFGAGGGVVEDFNESRFSPRFNPVGFYTKQLLGLASASRSWQALGRKLRGYQPLPQESRGFLNNHIGPRNSQRELFQRVLQLTSGYCYQNVDAGRIELFRHIVRVCRERQIDLHIAFLPVHALDVEVLYVGGRWHQFEELKTKLVNVVAEEGAEDKVDLWDFTGYAGPPTEPIPPWGNTTTRMKYYFENSHFTPECGRLVLDAMLGNAPTNTFGIKLTRANLKSHLARILEDRAAYARTNGAELHWVQQIVSDALKKNKVENQSAAPRI